MKRYSKIAVLAICLAFGVHSSGFTETHAINCENFGGGNKPNGIRPNLAKSIIKAACQQAGMNSQVAWVNYVQDVNTIEKIPGFYRVTMLAQGGTFVIIDVIDDL